MALVEGEIRDNVSTDELLEHLAGYGATRANLAYCCRHGYLPHPMIDVHQSGRGRGGWYPGFVVPRARAFFRLRRTNCDPRTIRLILFLHDGWGWEYLRDDCVASAAKVFGISLNGLKRYAPTGEVDDFAVDNIIEHQHQWLLNKVNNPSPNLKPTSQETTRFIVGTFGTGTPIKGASGSRLSGPLLKLLSPKMGRFRRWLLVMAFDIVTAMLDLRSDRMLRRIETVGEKNIQRGRYDFRCNIFMLRRMARRSVGGRTKGVCFSIISLGDHASKIDQKEFAKCGLSMYQMLAAFVGISVAMSMAFEELYETLNTMLPILTRSLFRKRQQGDSPSS